VLQRERAPAGVEADADRIEAELRRPRPLRAAPGEPLARHGPDLTLLARPDGGKRPEHITARRPVPDDPRLHLAEHEKARIARDDVELPIPGPKVPLDHLEPTRLEMPRRQLLATSAKPAPGVVSHAGDARTPGSTRVWHDVTSR
jgi:hypothetical protein